MRRTAVLGLAWLAIGRAAFADPPLEIGAPRAPERFTLEQRLLDAARRGDAATALRALDKGAALDAKDETGRDALLLAAREQLFEHRAVAAAGRVEEALLGCVGRRGERLAGSGASGERRQRKQGEKQPANPQPAVRGGQRAPNRRSRR